MAPEDNSSVIGKGSSSCVSRQSLNCSRLGELQLQLWLELPRRGFHLAATFRPAELGSVPCWKDLEQLVMFLLDKIFCQNNSFLRSLALTIVTEVTRPERLGYQKYVGPNSSAWNTLLLTKKKAFWHNLTVEKMFFYPTKTILLHLKHKDFSTLFFVFLHPRRISSVLLLFQCTIPTTLNENPTSGLQTLERPWQGAEILLCQLTDCHCA